MRLTEREKEWNRMNKAEQAFLSKGYHKKESRLDQILAEKIPEKLQTTLDAAFAKGFEAILEKGTLLIEKTYNKEEIELQHQINAYAVAMKENRKSLRRFSKDAASSNTKNMLLSGVEGIGLGILGIGLPDIPIFVGVLLKSIYEVALHYGYSYDTTEEQYFILKMIETSLSHGADLVRGNEAVNTFIQAPLLPENYNPSNQIAATSATMSKELLYLKFLQGIPVVGAVGGAYNTVYLQQVLKYVKLKYQQRFLHDKESNDWTPDDAG